MQKNVKDILMNARYAALELQSLDEALKTVNNRIYAVPSARITDESRGSVDPCAKEALMDQRNVVAEKLSIARLRTSAALMKAEDIIESVEHPRIRAALRYYYICRKSTREISCLLGCDERSVRRWVYGE
jgi:hypothetical protein